ncbi:Imidazolonepropionase [Streptomyces sp. 2323.1]|uniref:amidohydrolase family protein n=1 Tax=Streptomyces sp. 2323.1 TaxID=1938841 RepID=UPI000BB94F88|nr:amidohydrolase family protein [Streptomyces sp. 2323.1]SOE15059.1 Imidazolonepropionase [Streptomyces sp. 2323.1]
MTDALFTADQVITGPNGARITDGAVLVRGDRIAAVGPREEIERLAPEGLPARSVPHGTLLPGLIDSHVHLIFDGGANPLEVAQQTADEELLEGMADRAQQLLHSGVTTVRDLGDRNGLAIRLRDAITNGALPGPRILSSATPLTSPGGHLHVFGGEVTGQDAIRTMVRRNADLGAEVIKVMATGGGMTKGGPAIWQNQFTEHELSVVVDEAARHGLPVAVHAHGTDGIAAAVRAGVATIEHCTWMTEGGEFDLREDLATQIKSQGVSVCTATSPNWRGFAERVGQERAEYLFGSMRWMADLGVPMIAGTDAGVTRAVFDGLVNTLEFYEYLGLSNAKILDMATTDAAQALGITGTGRIAEGQRADIIAVDGDPLVDLGALRNICLVIAGGERIR